MVFNVIEFEWNKVFRVEGKVVMLILKLVYEINYFFILNCKRLVNRGKKII